MVERKKWKYTGEILNEKGEWVIPKWLQEKYEEGCLQYDFEKQEDKECKLFLKNNRGSFVLEKGDLIILNPKGFLQREQKANERIKRLLYKKNTGKYAKKI